METPELGAVAPQVPAELLAVYNGQATLGSLSPEQRNQYETLLDTGGFDEVEGVLTPEEIENRNDAAIKAKHLNRQGDAMAASGVLDDKNWDKYTKESPKFRRKG